jgi:DNA polymerase
VKRRPPENRDPLPEEIEAYKPYLARQIEIINPKIIATLGRFSMNYFLPEAKISAAHGRVFEWQGHILYPLYHPAAALRATSVLEELRRDFRRLPGIVAGDSSTPRPGLGVAGESKTTKKPEKPAQSKLF